MPVRLLFLVFCSLFSVNQSISTVVCSSQLYSEGGEKNLLFEALCNTLGEDNVYHVSKEDANSNPTRYHVSVTPSGHVVKYAN